MKTILRMGDKREACTSCSTISPDERLFLNPILPVAQNVQPILQPTCGKAKCPFNYERIIETTYKNQRKRR